MHAPQRCPRGPPRPRTREGARVALDASDRVMQEAARNRNRRTCVLLKTPMTPPVVEETMSRWLAAERENEVGNYHRRDEEPPSAVVPEIVFSSKIFSRGYNSVVAEAKEEVAHVEARAADLVAQGEIAAAGAIFPSDADPLMVSVGLVRPKALRDGVRFATLSLRLALAFVRHWGRFEHQIRDEVRCLPPCKC